jgi:hypothetical protein
MITFKLVPDLSQATNEETSALSNGGEPLRALCRKEVERFNQYLRLYGREYVEGLAHFEAIAIEGYLYQKLKGHIDAQTSDIAILDRRQNGTA